MGFFSSRKAEDNESYQVAIGVGGHANDKSSVVQVIRSRFVRLFLCFFIAFPHWITVLFVITLIHFLLVVLMLE
ncbi:hypothetical protein BDZ97DRAFT_1805028 [Flammula alnicola]|nr:hypothetical protein BDZ97DRAFT_1805028 [Flammula alnicola]